MAQIDVTRISSKGQIVIPADMRRDLKEGDKLIIMRNGDQIILKKESDMDGNIKEDLEFARRTEIARKKIEAGEGTTMEFDEFIKEMKKW